MDISLQFSLTAHIGQIVIDLLVPDFKDDLDVGPPIFGSVLVVLVFILVESLRGTSSKKF